MFYNPDIDKYCTMSYKSGRNKIIYSENGAAWEKVNVVAEDGDVALSEIAGAWCGENRIIALIRDNENKRGHPLLQGVSTDNGKSWSEPQPTNIPPDQHWGCAPQLIYDQDRNLLIALNSDRYSRPDKENRLFIYTASPREVVEDPGSWNLQHDLKRPWARAAFEGERPVNKPFYGYPTIAQINENEYLVVFTERAKQKGSEQADLFYFRLVFD